MTVLLPASVADANWFLLASTVPLLLSFLLLRWWSRSKRNRGNGRIVVWILILLFWLLILLGVGLEAYHANDCPNSTSFHSETKSVAKFLLGFLNARDLPYWITFGDLLFVLRQQTEIPAKDSDADVAMLDQDFFRTFSDVYTFARELQQYSNTPVNVQYRSNRSMIQVYGPTGDWGPHIDLWLFNLEKDNVSDALAVVHMDRTIRAHRLPHDQVFPLTTASTAFEDGPVKIPFNASFVAEQEYGSNFMTPVMTRLECIENVYNGFTFYNNFALGFLYASSWVLLSCALTVSVVLKLPKQSQATMLNGHKYAMLPTKQSKD